MKRILSLLLALMMLLQLAPAALAERGAYAAYAPGVNRLSLHEELETYGSVEAAMDAYALKRLEMYTPIFATLSTPGLLAFRAMAEKFDTGSGSLFDAIGEVMLTLGYVYAETDGNWKQKEYQVGLYIKYLLMLAEMETLTFEEVCGQVSSLMPRRDVVADELSFITDVLGAGLDVLGDGFLNVGKEFLKGDAAFKGSNVLYQVCETTLKGSSLVNASGESLINVVDLFSGARALPQVLGAWQRQASAQDILDAMGRTGIDVAELGTARDALINTYAAYENALAELSSQPFARGKLEDPEYLDKLFQSLLSENTAAYLSDGVMTVLETSGRIADAFLTGGLGSVITKGMLNIGQDMLGTKSAYTHLHAMSTIDDIYQTLLDAPYDETDWQECIALAENARRLSTLAMIGETHVYTLNTENAGAIGDFWRMIQKAVTNKDPLEDTRNWYARVSASMEEVSLKAEEYINDLLTHYDALCSVQADISHLLGHGRESTGVICGYLTRDLWYALPDGSGRPDYENPNPDAGEPVKNTAVELRCGDTVLATATTAEDGYYEFTYLRSQATGRLTVVVDPEAKEYATLEVDATQHVNQTLPSDYRWNADEEPPQVSVGTVSLELPYADDYFIEPAYSHDLAIASLGLSAAAPDAEMIHAAWGKLGYSVVSMGNYDMSLNTLESSAPYTIATKVFEDPDARGDEPKQYRVIALCVGSALESAGLAHAIAAGDLQTARDAARPITRELEATIGSLQADDTPIRLWMMGFSWGGKVADAVYVQMVGGSALSRCTLAGMYTFAAPGGQALQGYNFVYAQDPVGMGLTDPSAKAITFGPVEEGDAQKRIASLFHSLSAGNTAYDPATYVNQSALPDFLAELPVSGTDRGALLAAVTQWCMLRDDAGTDFRLVDGQTRHAAALCEMEGRACDFAADAALAAMASVPLPVFKALPEELEQTMEQLLTDVLCLYAAAGGVDSAAVNGCLLRVILTAGNDLGSPTASNSSMFAHHPEMYLAWLLGMSGEELAGRREPDAFGARVLQLPFNLQGVTVNEETGLPLPNVKVTISGEKNKTREIYTDENGYWKALVVPEIVKLKFEQKGFETVKESVVVPEVQPEEKELHYTYMKKHEFPVLIVTTQNLQEESGHYSVDIGRPVVWSSLNPKLTDQVDKAIAFLFAKQDKSVKTARNYSCTVHTGLLDSVHIKPTSIYSNGYVLSMFLASGGFNCDMGHDYNDNHGFTFDVTTGKSLLLEDLFDPDNPNAKQDFIALLGSVDQYYDSIRKKLYTHLAKPESKSGKYASWTLDAEGMHISVENLNIGVPEIDGTVLSYESLQGILDERFLPQEPVGGAEVCIAGSDAVSFRTCGNTPESEYTVLVKGLLDQIWIREAAFHQREELADRVRYFYAFGLDDAVITLPPDVLDYGFSIRWVDSLGVHHVLLDEE